VSRKITDYHNDLNAINIIFYNFKYSGVCCFITCPLRDNILKSELHLFSEQFLINR